MFLGIQPILTEYLHTDNSQDTLLKLRTLPPKNFPELLSLIEGCLHNTEFPHSKTIWQFNTPDIEFLQMTHILKNPKNADEVQMKITSIQHLTDFANLHRDTYPLVEVPEDSTDAFKFIPDARKALMPILANPKDPPKTSLKTYIIPAIAATSLYLIAKNTMEGL